MHIPFHLQFICKVTQWHYQYKTCWFPMSTRHTDRLCECRNLLKYKKEQKENERWQNHVNCTNSMLSPLCCSCIVKQLCIALAQGNGELVLLPAGKQSLFKFSTTRVGALTNERVSWVKHCQYWLISYAILSKQQNMWMYLLHGDSVA